MCPYHYQVECRIEEVKNWVRLMFGAMKLGAAVNKQEAFLVVFDLPSSIAILGYGQRKGLCGAEYIE